MFDFDALSTTIVSRTVLCVGDLMLDEFVYGEVSRISPEAPAPVIAVQRSVVNVGGAGNVARNIAALGARCIFVGLIGEDEAGRTLKAELAKEEAIEALLVSDAERPTTRKVRFVSEHFSTHLLRADWEIAAPASAALEQKLIDTILPQLARADIVLLSDYAKGVLTARVIRNVIDAARKLGKRVIVDPKSANFALYRGATLLTPNRKEFAEATRSRAETPAAIAAAAQDAMVLADCEAMLVTQGEHGMILVPRGGEPIHVPAIPVRVRDVSGAGDTVAAMLALALAAGADWETALRSASAAAAVAVSKTGTAVVTLREWRRRILPHAFLAAEEKIVSSGGDLDGHLSDWRRQQLRIGFTNGCFDILHPGHVKVLTAARAACDRLIVGLNSDASTRRLKGEARPVQNERARAEVLAALEAVDLVVIFEEDTPLGLITRIKPSVLVKGGDYTREQVVGHDIVAAHGGEVVLVDIMPGFSTTSLVNRARGKAGDKVEEQGMMLGVSMPAAAAAPPFWRTPAVWAVIADLLAAMIAVTLPWSTSLVAIYAVAWLLVAIPMSDFPTLVRSLRQPVNVLPIALFALAALGTLWSVAPWAERLHALGPAGKLLMLPLLIHHFSRSSRGLWVFVAFLASCTLLMLLSWGVAIDPRLALKSDAEYGVPVKNYIDQSQSFGLCVVALGYPVIVSLRRGKFAAAAVLTAIAASLLANMIFVVISRTALIAIPLMLGVFALLHLSWRSRVAALCTVVLLAGGAWLASPRLQATTGSVFEQYNRYERIGDVSSMDLRLAFWRKSLDFLAEAPLLGHGTGSIRGLFERAAVAQEGAAAAVIANPHNQILNVAVQWGTVGIAVLCAMWLVHLLLFRGDDLASWIGLLVVVQNVVSSLFNSHLFDFHEGWMYVLGVGVAGGMVMRARAAQAAVPASCAIGT